MNKDKVYLPPTLRAVECPAGPVLVLSARPGSHEYDEGIDTDEGWADAWSGD